MTISAGTVKERFEGCLFGLAVGDALGGKFEAQSSEAIRRRFASAEQLIAYPQDEIWYTDDTQMAIGMAPPSVVHQSRGTLEQSKSSIFLEMTWGL